MRINSIFLIAILIFSSFARNLSAETVSAKVVSEKKVNSAIARRLVEFGRCLAVAKKDDDQIGEKVCQSVVNFSEAEFHDIGHCLSNEPKFFTQGNLVDKSHNKARYFLEVLCNGSRLGVAITGEGTLLRVESVSEILP